MTLIHEANAWALARHMVAVDSVPRHDHRIFMLAGQFLSAALALSPCPIYLLRVQSIRL